jgi:hypothetical protein
MGKRRSTFGSVPLVSRYFFQVQAMSSSSSRFMFNGSSFKKSFLVNDNHQVVEQHTQNRNRWLGICSIVAVILLVLTASVVIGLPVGGLKLMRVENLGEKKRNYSSR